MPKQNSAANNIVAILILISTCAGLFAAYKRFHVEASNRRVEIAVEWQEIATLSQASGQSIPNILEAMKSQHVSTVAITEDTITTLEQSGAVHPVRSQDVNYTKDGPLTIVFVGTEQDLARIKTALTMHGLSPITIGSSRDRPPRRASTFFQLSVSNPTPAVVMKEVVYAAAEYSNLRTLGLGLAPDAVATVQAAGMRIAGRISNFPGVDETSARTALESLAKQGASTVVFSGDEILGFRNRGLEKSVAAILKSNPADWMSNMSRPGNRTGPIGAPAQVPVYGAVEFGKQKGDEKLSVQLQGDYVRVHTIQAAEMGQMEDDEAIDRFVRAAKERNIRFCYVRLLTFAGPDPVGDNIKFLSNISRGMAHGSVATGGDMAFGPARRYPDTGVPTFLFGVIALGATAGVLWSVQLLAPLSTRNTILLTLALSAVCVIMAMFLGEAGRKLVAFIAGIAYPTVACLVTYPGRRKSSDTGSDTTNVIEGAPPVKCLVTALNDLGLASVITAIGIVQVVGLLATRPFMLRANQFLGIKAQHAVPLIIVAIVAIAGGLVAGENWDRLRDRAMRGLRAAMDEPARFGTLLLGIVALAAFVLVVARTGNDAGVGVSGAELKVRAILDRILPVRPRTKEFLVGHPAFLLALAWWYRGRRRLAIPAFVVGSLGQVSLLNTFCHIHTPLIISVWRDGLGLLFGALIGAALFLGLEALFAFAGKSSKSAVKASV